LYKLIFKACLGFLTSNWTIHGQSNSQPVSLLTSHVTDWTHHAVENLQICQFVY